jgi:uncharacterized OB-fold protein
VTAASAPAGLFTVDPPALLGQHCAACGRYAFPCTTACPLCGAPDPQSVTLPTTGTLWAWTTVTAPPPGYVGEVPYGFGVVELPGGLRVVTRLAGPVDGFELGQPMELRLVELGRDDDAVLTWEFAPAAAVARPDPAPGATRP